MNNLSNLEPKDVFKWFYEINQHPRSSGKEQEISDFLMDFAKERDLEAYQDEALNVIIKKPGTPGYENSETVIIQGHMDMVCVKNDDSNHNFDTDPIEMVVKDGVLSANGTTLGADDGIAVAYGLAILDSNEIPHPPLELLVTTCEEEGMDGVMALTAEHLTGTILLNLDTEEEGEFLVSCAGGSNIDMSIDVEKEDAKGQAYEIEVSGLKGGHSGGEIHKQRCNAIKAAVRLLARVNKNITLSSIEGGIKHNAVPSYAKAVFLTEDFSAIEAELNKLTEEIKVEYTVEEPGLKIEIKPSSAEKMYTKSLSEEIINFLMILPDGVQEMSKDIEGIVQTSLNNAILGEKEGKLVLTTSVRSASASSLRRVLDTLQILSSKFGFAAREYSAYPAWQYEQESKVRDIAIEVFEKQYGEKPLVNTIHAGLECGLLKGILPDTDMLSYGPEIKDAHTPKEHMRIDSVERVWIFTKELLKNLK